MCYLIFEYFNKTDEEFEKIYQKAQNEDVDLSNAKEILEFVDDAVVVGCKIGSLQIGTIQPPSKKPMSAKAYCVGRGKRVGDSIV